MPSTLFSRCPIAYSAVVCYISAIICHGLVITGPTSDRNSISTTKEKPSFRSRIELLDLDLRIRPTGEGDIKKITNMLTNALLEEDALEHGVTKSDGQNFLSPYNFKFRKTRSGVAPLIESRMNTIMIGREIMKDNLSKGVLNSLTEAEQLRFLWSQDKFRNSVENAASLSNEPHIWKEHNFVCAPQGFNWLFHKMITAENTVDGEIIGFCEIAILTKPHKESSEVSTRTLLTDFDEECPLVENLPGVPTIVNLVTSPKYRRRGVGSSIMNSAIKFLQKSSFPRSEIALYVEEDNDAAIRLYERLGFQKIQRVESKKQWYMVRQEIS
eukprot:CAMPEP_0197188232 /NCGR_PEP_ID=MMETSP1423-20130617/17486_1 /TAXON_ID=476441 /ORGANISM="Pseudo-nitzschia heimii, Strain UNC1101" /LENGTH=326 /DNA_ID=CAMNT_0042640019 /DNA_START=269 /DNA_END=1246 /DNA_ORIENTATION=+